MVADHPASSEPTSPTPPDVIEDLEARLLAARRADDIDAFIEIGEALAALKPTEPLYYSLASRHFRRYHRDFTSVATLANLRAAIAHWERCVALNPDRLETYYFLGCYHNDLGNQERSQHYFSRLIEARESIRERRGLSRLPVRFVLGDGTIAALLQMPLLNGIAHLGLMDYYIKLKQLGSVPDHHLVLLDRTGDSVNPTFLEYFRPYVSIVEDAEAVTRLEPAALHLEETLNGSVLVDGEPVWHMHAISRVQRRWRDEKREPLMRLSDEHRRAGEAGLDALGIDRSARYVCLHVRDSGFRGDRRVMPNNANIDSYAEAIKAIVDAGYLVIRMGAPSSHPVAPLPGVVDYAHSAERSSLLDVYLSATAAFFVATQSGLSYVPYIFGTPIVMTNSTPIDARPFGERDLYIPKLHYSRGLGRVLRGGENFKRPLGHCYNVWLFDEMGIELVDNKPNEIADAARQMIAQAEGREEYDPIDDDRQRRYIELALRYEHPINNYGDLGRVARGFMNAHLETLLGSPDDV